MLTYLGYGRADIVAQVRVELEVHLAAAQAQVDQTITTALTELAEQTTGFGANRTAARSAPSRSATARSPWSPRR